MGFRLENVYNFLKNHYLLATMPLLSGFENFLQNKNFNDLLKGFRVRNKS